MIKNSRSADLTDEKNFFARKYIDVIAGMGEAQTTFHVIKENELLLKQLQYPSNKPHFTRNL